VEVRRLVELPPPGPASDPWVGEENTIMNNRSIPVPAATSPRIRRSILGTLMLLAVACCRATGTPAIEDSEPRSALVMAVADVGKLPPRDVKPPSGDTNEPPSDVKPPGDDTKEPPGDLPIVIVDDPADDDTRA
jgi:hypothetical protein